MALSMYLLLMTALPYCRSTVLHCDFDSGTKGDTYLPCECSGQSCSLEQAIDDQFDWTVHQGSTPSDPTGPDDDHTRSDSTGLYIYTEVSAVATNSTAEIRTPPLSLSVTSCLTFWYHMKGYHVGDLSVLATYTDASSSVIWQRSGEQGGSWLSAELSVSKSIAELRFHMVRGFRADQPQGDIALDDIVIKEELCPLLHCDFDSSSKGDTYLPCECSGQSCSLEQATDDQFDWTVHQGNTTTAATGPEDDHTRSDGTGLYIYTEVSGVPNNSMAEIRTPPLSLSVTSCLTFWYHMKGQHIDQLSVLATYTDKTSVVIWQRSGEQGNTWRTAELSLSKSITELRFRMIRRYKAGQPFGDIALDDIVIENKLCPGSRDMATESRPDPAPTTDANPAADPVTTRDVITTPPATVGPTSTPTTAVDKPLSTAGPGRCPSPFYGQNCETRCGSCVTLGLYSPCDGSGVCINGCMDWWIGDRCNTEIALPGFTTQTVSRRAATSDSITIDWEQINVPADLIGYYGYTVFYQSTTDTVTGLTHVPQASSRTLTVTLSDLTFNTEYNIEVRPYRQRGGVTEYGQYYPAQTYRTKCKAPVPPDVTVSKAGFSGNLVAIIVVKYTLSSDTGCDALTRLRVEYRLTGSNTWSSRDASMSAMSLTLEPDVAGTYEVRMTVRNSGDLQASTGIYKIDVEDLTTFRTTPTYDPTTNGMASTTKEQTAVETTLLPCQTTTATEKRSCTPCITYWGLLGASLAVMLVSITINVMTCVKNHRRTSSTDHHPTEHHYENKGVATAGRTSKDPNLQSEVRKPVLGDVADYETVDVGPSSAVHSPATGPLYANSGQGQRSDYDNIPSDELSTDTSQTTEGQGHYERMQQVRELPPNPYDVTA